jgi:hypothetical protein
MGATDDMTNERKTAIKVPKGSNETKITTMSFDVVGFATARISCANSSAGAREFYENCDVNSLSEGMSITRSVTGFGFGADAPEGPRTP